MDNNRFDNLTRYIGEQKTRRNMIKAAAGSTLAVLGMSAAPGGSRPGRFYSVDWLSERCLRRQWGLPPRSSLRHHFEQPQVRVQAELRWQERRRLQD